MRKLITAALLAATAIPAVASAQSDAELHRDRRDIRQEQRQLDDARAHGDRRDVRDERRDVRDARQDYRGDLRDRDRRWADNDWRDWRGRNRALYAGGAWRAPFRYNQFRDGGRIAPAYYGRGYWIAEPWRYHLAQPIGDQRWVRHYNDLLLVDIRRGYVVRVIRGFYF
jgi:Ni/Co efflux regulator RcnB